MRLLGLIFSITVLCSPSVRAQERFFNFVEGWFNNYTVEGSNSYLLFGLGSVTLPLSHKFTYNYLDYDGNTTQTLDYIIDTVESTATWNTTSQVLDLVGPDTAYIVSYLGNHSVDSAYGAVFRYIISTEQFELIHTNSDDELTQFICIQVKNDTSLLIAAFLSDYLATNERTRLYEMDMSGNIRWQRTFYGGSLTDTRPQQIEVMSNGNIALLLNEWDPNYPAFHEHEQAIVVMMDSVGNELWRVSPGDTDNYRIWPGGMVELPNGELLVSYTDPYYFDEEGEWHFSDSNTVHLASYDFNGNFNWEVDYLYEIENGLSELGRVLYRVRQMQSLADGNILITGTTGYGGLMLKVEPDGSLVWFREHLRHPIGENQVTSEHTHIYHTLPTSDGGFLCTGQYRSDPGNIYPSGIQTAIALKVDEYGCLEEGCGPNDAVAELATAEGLQVWPNPSNGLFKVQLSPELLGNSSTLEVWDIQGRVVRSQPVTHNSQPVIDLTQHPKGLYLVRLSTDKEIFTTKIIKQ